jgi:14-3-3 protein epsilon
MVEAMNSVAKLDEGLTKEERNLLSVGYKNLIGAKRAAMRIIGSIELKEETKGKESHVRQTAEYRRKVEAEMDKICCDVINIIDKYLIPHSSGAESSVFYYKMKGDYYRYLAEFKTGTEKIEVSELSLNAYEACDPFFIFNLFLFSQVTCFIEFTIYQVLVVYVSLFPHDCHAWLAYVCFFNF